VVAWGVNSRKYVQYDVHNVYEYLAGLPGSKKLTKKAPVPFTGGYTPELGESPELDHGMVNFFQSQIGILRWWVELGRIGIITDVSMLSTYIFLPHEGHMDDMFHVFSYLAHNRNMRVVFDPTYPVVDMCASINTDWKSMYGYIHDLLPCGALTPTGRRLSCARLLILIMLVSISQGLQGLDL
jgi:hypothetical protein